MRGDDAGLDPLVLTTQVALTIEVILTIQCVSVSLRIMRTADPWTALGDPTRREIFARVAAHPSSVTRLADGLPISRPAVSQHLQVLLEARLVDVHPQGRRRIYAARPDGLAALREELDRFWSQALSNFKRIAEEPQEEHQ